MPVENGAEKTNGQRQAEESGGSKSGGIPGERGEGEVAVNQESTDEAATGKEDLNNVTPIMNGKYPNPTESEVPNAKDTPSTKKTDGSASFLRAARAGNLEKVLEFLNTNTDINACNANGLNALHLASKEGHVNVVSALIERNANVDSATKKGNTALHIASLAGQDEIVKVLVENGACVNIQSQNGFTPLYMAAQENHDSVVRYLLGHGANQSLATEDGFTPLAVALQQGHDRVVSVLLENDTRGKVRLPALHIAAKKDDAKAAALLLHTDHNPDITSKSGFTPLHIASHYGNDNIAALLIQRGADVNYVAKHQITPLHVASKWGKGNMVSLLLDKGANIEAKTRDGLTPLHCAARSGHETVVDMLLEKGAPITAKTKNGLAPLHMASQGDHQDAARILLYHKAPVDDVTVDFLTALHVAAHCGHVRVAKLLLDRKADPNSRALNGFTPLHIACKKNRIKVVELLLKHGASIEATTESGLTPLHVASFMGCMNIVIYLIQHGASADVPTVRGESPLHLAARANQTDIIRILLRNGAEVDAKAREQQTALHIASRLGNTDIVGLLLQQGASVDAPTKDLYTPLHIAAKEGQEEVAGVLLDHGASLSNPTKKGFTPLHLAAKYGHMKVARLLLQRDAPVDPKGKNGVTPLHVAAHYDHQNVALLLLDKGAQPHATAKNGYTPLHIAARKNQMDIAGTLLEYGANANAESKAGFTPLHLSAQEGHTDMATLLLEHGAQPGGAAKNGLTPLHLCAQEDRVPVGAILIKHGASVDPQTKAGYTPLHVASHFGQMNMVRFLIQHGTEVDAPTQLGYTPLHQAAQQGHTQIVNLLLENKAQPNMETHDGKTALSIAQRLGYISVVETLKVVTETRVLTTTTTTTEEKYKVVVPETMHETFMSESEDEGADDTMLGDQSYRYLTVDEMKSLGDDSLPIDVTRDEKIMDVSFQSNVGGAAPTEQHISPQMKKELLYAQNYPADNVDIGKAPILAGPESLNATLNTSFNLPEDESQLIIESPRGVPETQVTQDDSSLPPTTTVTESPHGGGAMTHNDDSKLSHSHETLLEGWDQFLVSFMVDARGGAMRGCRHSGVRVIIPPRKAAMPMRITCRYLKKDKLVHAPPLMEGEALASRILEMGPSGAKFLGPVIIEVPHFASLRGKEREIVILRSDNGETWREHTLEATEEAVQEVLNESFDGDELKQLEDLNTSRITRILTTDFPQYFAIVTRIRQEVHAIGPEGGMVSSTVVPQVQAVFPQGALTKKIKVGLQAQPISPDLVAKLLGNRVAVSPIVTVEPRRRKFHKPITLTIPVPQAASKGMINQYSGEAPTLRLLCSITGGTTRAQWEDVTGSTPLTFVNDCVSFTTTVSARFWLMDCTNIPEATKMATELYREAIHVPFMAKFVVFSKRHAAEEARVRVFCMTDDKEDKTLETQEHFIEVAKSRDVEVLEGKSQYLELAGNLVPVTKSGDQLAFNFYAFRENRLPFTVRVKDQNAESAGRIAFMRQPKVGRGDAPQSPICNLNLSLPDNIQPEPAPSEPDLLALEKKYAFLSISKADTIHKADLRLPDISNMLAGDWVALAKELELSDSDINIIKSQYPDNAPQQGIVMLRLWMQVSGNKATGNTLEKALRAIHRDDIVDECICNLEVVTDDSEKAVAKKQMEVPPLGVNKGASPEVSYEEKDIMKEAESAEEEEDSHKILQVPNGEEEEGVNETTIVPEPRSTSAIHTTSQVIVESFGEPHPEEHAQKIHESQPLEDTLYHQKPSAHLEPSYEQDDSLIFENRLAETIIEETVDEDQIEPNSQFTRNSFVPSTRTEAEEVISNVHMIHDQVPEYETEPIQKYSEPEDLMIREVSERKVSFDQQDISEPEGLMIQEKFSEPAMKYDQEDVSEHNVVLSHEDPSMKLSFKQDISEPEVTLDQQVLDPRVAFDQSVLEPEAPSDQRDFKNKLTFDQDISEPSATSDEWEILEPEASFYKHISKPEITFDHVSSDPEDTYDQEEVLEPKAVVDQVISEPEVTYNQETVLEQKSAFDQDLSEPEVSYSQGEVLDKKLTFDQDISQPEITYDQEKVLEQKAAFDQVLSEPEVTYHQREVLEPKLTFDQDISEPEITHDHEEVLKNKIIFNENITEPEATFGEKKHTKIYPTDTINTETEMEIKPVVEFPKEEFSSDLSHEMDIEPIVELPDGKYGEPEVKVTHEEFTSSSKPGETIREVRTTTTTLIEEPIQSEFSIDGEESLIHPEQVSHPVEPEIMRHESEMDIDPMIEIPDGKYTQQPEVKVTHEEFTSSSEPGEIIRTVRTTRTIIEEPSLENESYEPETEFAIHKEESLIQPEQGFHPMVEIPDGTYTQQPEVKVTHEEFTTGSEPGETIRTVKTTRTIMGEPTLENIEDIRSSLESYEPGTDFSMDREESLIQPEQGFRPMVEIPYGTYAQQPEVKVTHEEFTTGSEPGETIRTVKTTTTRTIMEEPTLENVEDIRSSLESYEPGTDFSMDREESLIQPEQGFHPMVEIPDGTYAQQPEVKVTHEEFTTGSEPGETIRTVKTTTRTIMGEPTLENVEGIRSSLESYEPGTEFSMDREESLIQPEQGFHPMVEIPDGTYTQQPEVKVTHEEFTTGSEPGEAIRTVKTTTTRTIIGEPTLENVEDIRSSLESYEPETEFSMGREESVIQPEQGFHPMVQFPDGTYTQQPEVKVTHEEFTTGSEPGETIRTVKTTTTRTIIGEPTLENVEDIRSSLESYEPGTEFSMDREESLIHPEQGSYPVVETPDGTYTQQPEVKVTQEEFTTGSEPGETIRTVKTTTTRTIIGEPTLENVEGIRSSLESYEPGTEFSMDREESLIQPEQVSHPVVPGIQMEFEPLTVAEPVIGQDELLITSDRSDAEEEASSIREDGTQLFKLVTETSPAELEEAVPQDGFTQPSAEASQMVQGPPAPSDVKPTAPVVPAGHVITEQRPIEKEIGDFESSAADGPKVEARTKSPLREADLSVLDSLMTTQDAQIEEMTFTHTMDDTQAQKDNVTRSQPSFSSQFQSETDSTNAKPKLPPKNKAGTKRRAPPPPPRKDPIEATDKKDPDVSPKKARGAPEWGGQTSSDEGEEQLTLMRDSPRWEDEEIQAEDHDEPRPIKAEIKLLVKTTELGKESIEIRSIREFMDPKDKTVADADASEGQAKGETLQHISLSTTSEDTHAHHHPSPQGGKASPRFVRPKETFSSHEKETDDFDLMAQVRDVIAETETEKAFITHCDSDQESSKKSPKKKKKGPK